MINYLEHHIVDHCNLNCAGCSHFSPLVQEKWFEDIEDFRRDFSKLASLTEVRTIRLMGGEPLLHPQVADFIKIARELFPNTDLQIVTNGLLLKQKKEDLMDLCNSLRVTICVSDYRLINLREALAGFQYVRVDGKAQLYNVSLDLTGENDKVTSFNNCDLHMYHWLFFQGGRFYPCCVMANIHYFNKYFEDADLPTPSKDEISISIYDHSLEEINQFLNTPLEMCKYCDTIHRRTAYSSFHVSKKEITEWICR